MKKIISFITAAVILSVSVLLSGCGPENETADNEGKTPIRIAAMQGPTGMSLSRLFSDSDKGLTENKYEYELFGAADALTPKLINGELDIASIPANAASILYNKTNGKIKMLAVNTYGVLYILDKGENIKSIDDLKGKTVYCSGKGATPEYTLRYLLSENGISPDTDITLEFKNEAAEVTSVLANSEKAVAMLPQPYVTAALSKVEGLRVALDLNDEWDKLQNGSKIITGVVVATSDFIENDPDAVDTFLEEYEKSTQFVLENTEDAAKIIGALGIADENITKKALPDCNITYLDGEEMKKSVSGYFAILASENPQSIGGKVPGDDFYRISK